MFLIFRVPGGVCLKVVKLVYQKLIHIRYKEFLREYLYYKTMWLIEVGHPIPNFIQQIFLNIKQVHDEIFLKIHLIVNKNLFSNLTNSESFC